MKRITTQKMLFLGWLFAIVYLNVAISQTGGKSQISVKKEGSKMLSNVKWLGHATIKLSGSKIIYIDPYQLNVSDNADILLVTHDHFDHLSPKDIDKVKGPKSVIVLPKGSKNPPSGELKYIQPGDSLTIEGVKIKAVPAYNVNKSYHPKSAGYVGYVVELDGVKYYHAGDTDFIPEMKDLNVDVAFLPVGGTYTMTAAEAAQAANTIKPKVAVPMHYGAIVGSLKDAEDFKKLVTACEVQILTK